MRKLTTSAYHPRGNRSTERVGHIMVQFLSMVISEHQNDGHEQFSHVESAFNDPINTATGFAPKNVHLGRLPGSPITVIHRRSVSGHQVQAAISSSIATLPGSEQRVYKLVRERLTNLGSGVRTESIMTCFTRGPGIMLEIGFGCMTARQVLHQDD